MAEAPEHKSAAAPRPSVLSLNINSKSALYAAYMPFLRFGGIFIPTTRSYSLGDEVFMLLALMDDQELDSRRSTEAIYWEGAVRLIEDGRVVGRGYLEMTGYGERLRIG